MTNVTQFVKSENFIKKHHKILFLISMMLFTSMTTFGQVSGTIFKDFNANGTKDVSTSFNEVGIPGVSVTATNATGGPLTVTYTGGGTATNGTGAYSVTGGTLGQIRLVFTMPDGYTFASNGALGATTVVFPTTATQNLALNSPEDYWNNSTQADPTLVVSCYTNGTFNGPGKAEVAIVAIANNQGSLTAAAMSPTKTPIATHEQVGTVWGEARDKNKDRFFFSTLLKRHVGFGPKGVGGIYIIDKTGSGYALGGSFDLQGVVPNNTATAIDLGSVTRNTTTTSDDNYVPSGTNLGQPGRDLDAFAKVGKVAFGDMDIDDATNRLFAVNLNQRSIITVDVSGGTSTLNNATAATLKPLTNSYNIIGATGVPTCTSGELRPWGLKIYKGRGYLGVVCDGSTSQTPADAKSYILSFDINNIAAGFKTELTINNYTNYKPWANTWTQTGFADAGTQTALSWRQLILSDIEFDADGNMIIASLNRFGMQMGYFNYIPVSGSTNLVQVKAYADILKACYDVTTKSWSMGATTCPVPAGGSTSEFFSQDWAGDGTDESSNGALAILMGSQEVVNVASDPFPANVSTNDAQYYISGGLNWFSTVDGTKQATARLFKTTANAEGYGKAIGLGDVEYNLNAAPIEIGNRVWLDSNKDGFQDAGEAGISGITVTLCLASAPTTAVSTAVTDANGNYYFSSATGTSTASARYGLSIGLNTAYILKFPTSSGANSISPNFNAGANDLIDSDAIAAGTIALTTGAAGQNNHSFDVAYESCTTPTAASITKNPTGTVAGGATVNLTANATGTTAATTYAWAGPSSFSSTIQSPSTTAPATAGTYTYSVTISNGGTCTATATSTLSVTVAVPCTPITNLTASVSPSTVITGGAINLSSAGTGLIAGTTYAWSGPSGFTATTQNPSTTAPATAGSFVYSVSVQNNNGTGVCTASATTSLSTTVALTPCTPITNLTASVSPSTVITGGAINLSSAGTGLIAGTTYAWSGPSGFTATTQNPSTTAPATAGSFVYSVSVTNANGTGVCTASATTSLSTTVALTPCTPITNLTASVSPSTVITGGAINLSSAGTGLIAGTTYSWSGLNGFTATTQNPSTTAPATAGSFVYSVSVQNSNGTGVCTASATTSLSTTVGASCTNTVTVICTTQTVTLTTDAGLTNIQWYKDGVAPANAIAGETGSTYTTGTAGTYYYRAQNNLGCDVNTCCGVTIQTSICCVPPTTTASITPPTCAGATAQSNGLLRLSGFATERYQYSSGTTFNAATAIPASPTAIPSNSVINSTLTNTAQTYTVRIYTAGSSTCFTDRTISLTPVVCNCPPPKCVPVSVSISN